MGIEKPLPPADTAKPLSLSEALRQRTTSVHIAAERSGIISDILKRKADRGGYVLLLRNLLPAYEALESAIASRATDAVLGVFALPGLFRAGALRNDLVVIAGARYAERVVLAARGNGMRLIAHAYVR